MLTRRSLFFAALGTPVLAQQPEDPPFTLPDGVNLDRDIVYARYGSRELKLDLFRPKSQRGLAAGVVYIHGGGWRNGSRRAFARQAAHMASKGFVGACIEYRLSGEAIWPAAIHDAKAAVRWLRANSAAYNVNPAHIGAAGGSAGGHLASLLGTTQDRKDLEGSGGNLGSSSAVQSVAAFNPALDFPAFAKNREENATSAVSAFLGAPYADNPELWQLAAPVTHVGKRSAAHLFLHGTADRTVPYQQSLEMRNKLKALGVPTDLFTAEGAAHGFFNRPPWFSPTLQRMEQWFTETLR